MRELAKNASLPLSKLSGKAKADFLMTLAESLDSIVDALVETMTNETGYLKLGCRGNCENIRTASNVCQLVEEGS